MPELPGDLAAALERVAGVRLVVVDPLMSFLGEQFDACRDQNVRRCLFALARLAERHQVAILPGEAGPQIQFDTSRDRQGAQLRSLTVAARRGARPAPNPFCGLA
jgi:hypothetical protein